MTQQQVQGDDGTWGSHSTQIHSCGRPGQYVPRLECTSRIIIDFKKSKLEPILAAYLQVKEKHVDHTKTEYTVCAEGKDGINTQ